MSKFRRWNFELHNGDIYGCAGTHVKGHHCEHEHFDKRQLLEIIESLQNTSDVYERIEQDKLNEKFYIVKDAFLDKIEDMKPVIMDAIEESLKVVNCDNCNREYILPIMIDERQYLVMKKIIMLSEKYLRDLGVTTSVLTSLFKSIENGLQLQIYRNEVADNPSGSK